MRINKEDTLTLVIDYQERLMPAMADLDSLIKNSSILLEGLRILEVPFIVTQQYTKGLGNTVEPIRNALACDEYFDKTSFSIMGDDAIRQAVIDSGKKNVILCGAEAHICVLQSAIDLKASGYNVILIADCIASRNETNKSLALIRAQQEGIIISSCESILYELLQKAGSDQFKQISKLVK